MNEIDPAFLKHAWRATPASLAERLSAGKWTRKSHLNFISNLIADAAYSGNKRLIVSVPPRHGKSELISKWVPPWFLDRFPDKRVILASYGASLAQRFGRAVRTIATQNPIDLRFKLKADAKQAGLWETSHGGGMMSVGVGGPMTGFGADLLIIDDPIKNFQEAYSSTTREAIWDWWCSTAGTRIEPGGSVVLLMTRWHHDDLAGRLLKQAKLDPEAEQWEEVNLPAIAVDNDPMGRAPGEALWPERYGVAKLRQIEKRVGPIVWSALYQQSPRPTSGGLFKADRWQHYKPSELPARFERVIASWDLAFKDLKTSDPVVGQVWGVKGANAYLIDQERDRFDVVATIAAIRRQREKIERMGFHISGTYVEDKANGPAVLTLLRDKVPGLVPVQPDGSKEARAAAISPFQHAGNLHLPEKAPWVHEFVAEHEDFPNGEHDDQVDATSQAISQLWLGGSCNTGISISGDEQSSTWTSGGGSADDGSEGNVEWSRAA